MVPLSENQLQASFCSTQVLLLAEGQTERQLTSKSGLFHVEVGVGGLDVPSHLIAAYKATRQPKQGWYRTYSHSLALRLQ